MFMKDNLTTVPDNYTATDPLRAAIEVNDVGIFFNRYIKREHKPLQRSLTSIVKIGTKFDKFWALKHIDFTVNEGDIVGVIGSNGGGKTTLLKLLVGVLVPDEGYIDVNGKISALLALGAGFMPDLSGRENIYLNGSYMGLSRQKIDTIFNNIVEFAELEDFIDTPIRYYSSGMKTRLGFSVAVHSEPEILIVDEVLAAGDKNFRIKAEEKMRSFMDKAKAIVIATHNTNLVTKLCNRCLWIDKGRIRMNGPSDEVVAAYLES